jgi:uncharacterized protein YqhQ
MQALSFSANVAMEAEEPAEAGSAATAGSASPAASPGATSKKPPEVLTQGAIAVSLMGSLLFGIALFIYLPHGTATLLFNLVRGLPLGTEAPVAEPLFHVVAGAVKMSVFVAYILLIRRMKDIRRVFQYHGAEHKSIHTYEAGQELTVENARRWPTFHPRCGTSFLVFVILISIGFFAGVFPMLKASVFPPDLLGWKLTLLQATVKIPLMIPIAGISYEFIKWAGRRKDSVLTKLLGLPGRAVQKLTTIEPDDEQLEVALVSLKRTLEREGSLPRPEYANCYFLTQDAQTAA